MVTNVTTATATGARGRGGRRGHGRGGRARASPTTTPYIASGHIRTHLSATVDKMIPDAMKACTTGWKQESTKKRKFEVFTEEEYRDKYMRHSISDSYIHVSNVTASLLEQSGLAVNAANTIEYLISDRVFTDIATYTSQELVRRNLPRVDAYEMRRFFAHKLLRSSYNISTKKAWEACIEPLSVKHGFTLMEYERFNNILTSIRGYEVRGRSGDDGDETWLQKKNLLRRLNDLEKNVFKNAMNLFNTESGTLVVDDELVASRATDVETKVLSEKKAGKEGTMADCLAESTICLLLGTKYSLLCAL